MVKEEEESKEISIFDDVGFDYDLLVVFEDLDLLFDEDKKVRLDLVVVLLLLKFSFGFLEERDYFKNFRGGKVDFLMG